MAEPQNQPFPKDFKAHIMRIIETVSDSDQVTDKAYVDDAIATAVKGLDWQESVLDRYDPTGGLPADVSGNRYISTATANGWTDDYIYEGSGGSGFVETIPNEGYTTVVEDENMAYTYTGSAWVTLGSIIDHSVLLNRDWSVAGHTIDTDVDLEGNTLIGNNVSGGILQVTSSLTDSNPSSISLYGSPTPHVEVSVPSSSYTGFRVAAVRTAINKIFELTNYLSGSWKTLFSVLGDGKVKLEDTTNTYSATIQADTTQDALKINDLVNMSTKKITNMGDGTVDSQDGATCKQITELVGDVEGEPTGFPNRTASTLTFTDGTHTFSIQPTGTDFDFWQDGVKYTSTGDTLIIDHTTEGIHVIYYDAGSLTEVVSPTSSEISTLIKEKVLVSILYWDATNSRGIYVGEERHGLTMDGNTHDYLHFTLGMVYLSGLGLNTMSIDGTGVTADAQFGVDIGKVADEDIRLSISTIASTVGLPIYHMEGSTPNWRRTVLSGFSMRTLDNTSAKRLAYNQYTGGSWKLTEVSDADFVLYHIFATTEKDNPMISVMGQNIYTTKRKARTGAKTEIYSLVTDELLFPEIRPIATIICQTKTTYVNDVNCRIVSTDDGDNYIDWRNEAVSRVEVSTSDHNSLSGLQGGDGTDYYHADQSVNKSDSPTWAGITIPDGDDFEIEFSDKVGHSSFGIADSDGEGLFEVSSSGVVELSHRKIQIPDNDLDFAGDYDVLKAGAAVAWGDVCMLQTDSKYDPADASGESTAKSRLLFATETLTDGVEGDFVIRGYIRDDSWSWTAGGILYLSETTGEMTQTKPSTSSSIVRILGYAETSKIIWFNPDSSYTVVP